MCERNDEALMPFATMITIIPCFMMAVGCLADREYLVISGICMFAFGILVIIRNYL